MRLIGPIALTAIVGVGPILATSAISQTAVPAPAAQPNPVAAQVARGETLFNQRCASCHDPAIEGAPNRADLAGFDPNFISGVLKTGEMAPMARGLGDDDIKALATFLITY